MDIILPLLMMMPRVKATLNLFFLSNLTALKVFHSYSLYVHKHIDSTFILFPTLQVASMDANYVTIYNSLLRTSRFFFHRIQRENYNPIILFHLILSHSNQSIRHLKTYKIVMDMRSPLTCN